MIRGEVLGASEFIEKLRTLTPQIQAGLEKGMTRFLIGFQQYVKEKKLSGQVLHRRTGFLSRGVHIDQERTEAGVAGKCFVEDNVHYAAVHEYGGTIQVPAHIRTITKVFGREIEPRQISVKAHDKNYPERSYMRSALRDKTGEFRAMVRKAVIDGLKGGAA